MIDSVMDKLLKTSHISVVRTNIKKPIPDIKQELAKFDEIKEIEEKFKKSHERLKRVERFSNLAIVFIGVMTIVFLLKFFNGG